MVTVPQRRCVVLACSVLLAHAAGALAATTWYVDDNALGDPAPGNPAIGDPLENGSEEHPYDAIQEAISAAVAGDTILVFPGVYTGTGNRDIELGSKSLAIATRDGAANTIIDCQSLGRGFLVASNANPIIIEGFTIRHGKVTSQNGGGICCTPGSAVSGLTVKRCVIEYCEAQSGGGVFCQGTAPVFSECVIQHCTPNGARVYAYPSWSSQSTSPTFDLCIVAENVGSGILFHAAHNSFICGTTGFASGSVSRCVVMANGTNGIELWAERDSCSRGVASPGIINTLVANNLGHGLFLYGDGYSEPRIVNTTIARNSGTGVVIDARSGYLANVRLLNCIVALNATGISRSTDSAFVFRYNDVWGNAAANYGPNLSDQTGQNGNISLNPVFWDPDGTDGNPDNNYILSTGSPCIDAGNNTDVPTGVLADLAGKPRFLDDPIIPDTGQGTPPIVDMGAYEYDRDDDGDGVPNSLDLCPSTIPGATVGANGCPPAIPGDFDHDGDVDSDDLEVFRSCGSGPSLPRTPECASGDFDSDDDVDMDDFAVFQRCWSGENLPADPNCVN